MDFFYEFEELIVEKGIIIDLEFGVGFRKGVWLEMMVLYLIDLGEDWILIFFYFEFWWVKKLILFFDLLEIVWDLNLNLSFLYVNFVL